MVKSGNCRSGVASLTKSELLKIQLLGGSLEVIFRAIWIHIQRGARRPSLGHPRMAPSFISGAFIVARNLFTLRAVAAFILFGAALAMLVPSQASANVTGLTLTAASDTGASDTDGITTDTTPTISFSSSVGSGSIDWGDNSPNSNFTGTGVQEFTKAYASEGDYTITVTPDGGTAATLDITIDTTAPTISRTNGDNTAGLNTNSNSLVWVIFFSESLNRSTIAADDFEVYTLDGANRLTGNPTTTGASSADIVVSGGNTNNVGITLSGGDLDNYNGVVGVRVKDSATITDVAGNPITDFTPTGVTDIHIVDNTAPTIISVMRLIPLEEYVSNIAITLTFRVVFSEPIMDTGSGSFQASDIVLPGFSPTIGIADGPTAFNVITAGGGEGERKFNFAANHNIQDVAGNRLVQTNEELEAITPYETYTIDMTAPTITSITRQTPMEETTNANSLTFRVTFDDTQIDATTVQAADFVFTATPKSGSPALSGVTLMDNAITTSDNLNFDIELSGGNLADFEGTIALNLATTNAFTDAATNEATNLAPLTNAETYTVAQAPSVTLARADGLDTTITEAFVVNVDLSVAPGTANPFDASDITNAIITSDNAEISSFTGSGTSYSFTVTPNDDIEGDITIEIPAAAFQDAGGTDSLASNTLTITADTAPPSLADTTISEASASGNNLTFTITFPEEMDPDTVDENDFTVTDIPANLNARVTSVVAQPGGGGGTNVTPDQNGTNEIFTATVSGDEDLSDYAGMDGAKLKIKRDAAFADVLGNELVISQSPDPNNLVERGGDDNNKRIAESWLGHFGNSVAANVVEVIGNRVSQPRDLTRASQNSLRLAGREIQLGESNPLSWTLTNDNPTPLKLTDLHTPADLTKETAESIQLGDLTDLLENTSFELSLNGGARGDFSSGLWSIWGASHVTSFESEPDNIELDGQIISGHFGLDYATEKLLLGLQIAHHTGSGGYKQEDEEGDMDAALTGFYPYVGYTIWEGLDVWGLFGVGFGTMTMEEKEGDSYEPDTTLIMGALGVDGEVWSGGGLDMSVKADSYVATTASSEEGDLAETSTLSHRQRLALVSDYHVELSPAHSLAPSLELGVRYDGGDAQSGVGVEIGGGVSYHYPAFGLSVEGSGRYLVFHSGEGVSEWGAGGSVRFDPGLQGLGLSSSLSLEHGAMNSEIDQLWHDGSARLNSGGLDTPTDDTTPTSRLSFNLGYGLSVFNRGGTLTPYLKASTTSNANQTYKLGTRLNLASTFSFTLEAQHHPHDQDQRLSLKTHWRF